MYTFNPSTQKAEAGGSQSSELADLRSEFQDLRTVIQSKPISNKTKQGKAANKQKTQQPEKTRMKKENPNSQK